MFRSGLIERRFDPLCERFSGCRVWSWDAWRRHFRVVQLAQRFLPYCRVAVLAGRIE
jgi:hypothetical protein